MLPNGTHTIRLDSPNCWYRAGTVVIVDGREVTGPIWNGHKMTVVHSQDEMAALVRAVNDKRYLPAHV